MDRINLRQLGIISLVLALSACASSPQQQDESVTSSPIQEPVAVSQEAGAGRDVETNKAVSPVEAEPEIIEPEVASTPDDSEKEASMPEATPIAEPVVVKPAAEEKPKEVAKAAVELPTDPNTFLVQAGIKDTTHPFHGLGDKRGFIVNGVQGKTLVLTRGEVYNFKVDTGVQHDFYFSTSDRGWGAGTVTDGIEGQFTYEGMVKVSPNASTPSEIFYQCRNHKNMGGRIHVINKGETVKLSESVADGETAANKPAFKVTEQQVKQKLAYAKMLMLSESAKRISESDNAEAKGLKKKAGDYLAKAEASLTANKNVEAMAAVDEALRLINAANRLAPSNKVAADVDYKAQYEEMLREIEGYKKSYAKNAGKSNKADAKLDEKKFNELMADAKKLADANDHKAALKPLQVASAMITDAISVMLHDTVVVYDKDFATPQEEYEYEKSRYESYLELVPLAKEQHQPDARKVQLMDQFIEKAKSIASEGANVALKGDHKLAIQAYQAATDNVKRALMLVGVR